MARHCGNMWMRFLTTSNKTKSLSVLSDRGADESMAVSCTHTHTHTHTHVAAATIIPLNMICPVRSQGKCHKQIAISQHKQKPQRWHGSYTPCKHPIFGYLLCRIKVKGVRLTRLLALCASSLIDEEAGRFFIAFLVNS